MLKILLSGIIRKKEDKVMRKRNLKKLNSLSGAFLIELMIAAAILIIVLVGYLQLSIYCFSLMETARGSSIAIGQAQDKLEEIRNTDFGEIASNYGPGGTPGNIFSLTQLTGTGVIYIDSISPLLLEIEIVINWQEKGNRIIGEDTNLNGSLDVGEDTNGNGKLDSPLSLVTLIARR